MSINYNSFINNTGSFSATTSIPISFYSEGYKSYTQYVRTRSLPPNSIMPISSLGTPVNFPYINTVSFDEII